MEVYHVVTDKPLELGQKIIFDETHRSGVWKRVQDQADKAREIYADPQKFMEEELPYPVMVALRELALEEVRKEKYPDYPSRMSALYVSKSYEEAEKWAWYFAKIGRPTYCIVKLNVEGRSFLGDATKCFDGVPDHEENIRMAERYWKNDENEEPVEEHSIEEMLVDGTIEIMEVVKEVNANIDEKGIQYVSLREMPELRETAANWFHEKWDVPAEAYLECMDEYLSGATELGWYLAMEHDQIIGGLGAIENDFHDRKDLSPNICAVYTDPVWRSRGVAGNLLNMAVEDLRSKGISPVYLVTDHTDFYERYGWEFYCMAQGDGEDHLTRLYIHR